MTRHGTEENALKVVKANWQAPAQVLAFTTTRQGGVSEAAFATNNLGLHVGDAAEAVLANRQALKQAFAFSQEPYWLTQTHSTDCLLIDEAIKQNLPPYPEADASITRTLGQPLVIMTADCLPILLCDREGREIAAIHAGWRGLAGGIVENTLAKMQTLNRELLAWIGPAICQTCYQVGANVHEAFRSAYLFADAYFSEAAIHLAGLAEAILRAQGVEAVYQSGCCSFHSPEDFYSYRRQAETGRMATVICLMHSL